MSQSNAIIIIRQNRAAGQALGALFYQTTAGSLVGEQKYFFNNDAMCLL